MVFPIFSIFLYGFLSLIISFLLICLIIKLITKPYPNIIRYENEKYYQEAITKESKAFPSLDQPATIHLSVIVPAYNEQDRLPPMLDECLLFLGTRGVNYNYEVIVVSDGSRDRTSQIVHEYATKYGDNKIRLLDLVKNRGKGGAVRLGIQCARGALILFADADGATKFSDLTKLEKILHENVHHNYIDDPETVGAHKMIVIGSRAHLEKDATATRTIFRTFLMHGFHFLVWFFTVQGVRDTQCGFKLFTRQAARLCFSSLHVEGWAFDAELLYIAQKLKIPIKEVAVNWTEIDGSKITPIISYIQMGRDLILIWLKYKIGAWQIIPEKKL